MRIIGILGSPRNNGSTALLLDAVLKGAQESGAQVERINIAGMKMNGCTACGKCYITGRCIFDDEVEAVKAKMLAADGIVLASPNYLSSISAQLKMMLDRCSLYVHCFLLEGKYGASLATAGGGMQDEVAEYQNGCLQRFGALTVGSVAALGAGVGAVVGQDETLAKAVALGHDLTQAISEKRQYPDQAQAHAAFFQRMKSLVLHYGEDASYQYQHWVEKNWLP